MEVDVVSGTMTTGKLKQNERLNTSQLNDKRMRDFNSKLCEYTDSESEDGVDNVKDVVIDQAAEDDARQHGPPDTIPSNISGIRRFLGRKQHISFVICYFYSLIDVY